MSVSFARHAKGNASLHQEKLFLLFLSGKKSFFHKKRRNMLETVHSPLAEQLVNRIECWWKHPATTRGPFTREQLAQIGGSGGRDPAYLDEESHS